MNLLLIGFIILILCVVGGLVYIYFKKPQWFKKIAIIGAAGILIGSGGILLDYGKPSAITWIGVDSTYYEDSCGSSSYHTASEALGGTDYWSHTVDETHWVVIDLSDSYIVYKIRGRSNNLRDPTDVDIYMSEDGVTWGSAVYSGITTWRNTINWVEIDIPDTSGRYIKIEIIATEDINNGIGFGGLTTFFTIFDVYMGPVYVNYEPVQSDTFPISGVTRQSLNPTLVITTTDANAELMNITFSTNASGSWATIGVTNASQSNGTFRQTPTNMNEYGTKYWWNVSVNDGHGAWTNETYNFTTLPVYTDIDTISPYITNEDGVTLTVTNSSEVDNVSFYYRYSPYNDTWVDTSMTWVYPLNYSDHSFNTYERIWYTSDVQLSETEQTPLYIDGLMYVGTTDEDDTSPSLYCVYSCNGTMKWEHTFSDDATHHNISCQSPVIDGDVLYYSTMSHSNSNIGYLHCMDRYTGEILWTYSLRCGSSESLEFNDDVVILVSVYTDESVEGQDCMIYGINKYNGIEEWNYTVEGYATSKKTTSARLLLGDLYIFKVELTTYGVSYMRALNITDRTLEWNITIGVGIHDTGMTYGYNDTAIFINNGSYVESYNYTNGERYWQTNPMAYTSADFQISYKDGIVYSFSDSGNATNLYAFYAENGTEFFCANFSDIFQNSRIANLNAHTSEPTLTDDTVFCELYDDQTRSSYLIGIDISDGSLSSVNPQTSNERSSSSIGNGILFNSMSGYSVFPMLIAYDIGKGSAVGNWLTNSYNLSNTFYNPNGANTSEYITFSWDKSGIADTYYVNVTNHYTHQVINVNISNLNMTEDLSGNAGWKPQVSNWFNYTSNVLLKENSYYYIRDVILPGDTASFKVVNYSAPIGGASDETHICESNCDWTYLGYDDSYPFTYAFTFASYNDSGYYEFYSIGYNNTGEKINETHKPLAETRVLKAIAYEATIRYGGEDYFVWLGDEASSATAVAALLTDFDSSTEYIAVWDTALSWGSDGIWNKYYGDSSGTDFSVQLYDIIKVYLDGTGTQTIVMIGEEYPDQRTVTLTTGINQGANYVGWTDNASITANTIATVNITTTLDTNEQIWWWNETSYAWEYYIVGFIEPVITIYEDDILMIRVSNQETLIVGGK